MYLPHLAPWMMSGLIIGNLSPAALAHLTDPVLTSQADRCSVAISDTRRTLEAGRQLSVSFESYDIASIYDEYPSNRPDGYTLLLQGAAADSIMNSPQLMGILSADLITRCDTVSAVRFGVDGTGWQAVYGLMSNGQVEGFSCIEDLYGDDYSSYPGRPWGYQFCSL